MNRGIKGFIELGLFFIVFIILTISSFAAQATSTSCGEVSSDLTLTANIAASGTCFIFTTDGITIDGSNFKVTGDGTGYGINTNFSDNLIIRNLKIENFFSDINVDNSTNVRIESNEITSLGIRTSMEIGPTAINITKSSEINIVSNIINHSITGIFMQYSNGIIIDNNDFTATSNSRFSVYADSAPRNNSNISIISNNFNYYGILAAIQTSQNDNVLISYNNITISDLGNGLNGIPLGSGAAILIGGLEGDSNYNFNWNNLTMYSIQPDRYGVQIQGSFQNSLFENNNLLFKGFHCCSSTTIGMIKSTANAFKNNNFTNNFINNSERLGLYSIYIQKGAQDPVNNYFINNKIAGLNIYSKNANNIFYNLTLINNSEEITFYNITTYVPEIADTKGRISTFNGSVSVDSLNIPMFNTTSKLKLLSFTFSDINSFNIYKTEGSTYSLSGASLCLSPRCVKLTANPVSFEVSSFSSYAVPNYTQSVQSVMGNIENTDVTVADSNNLNENFLGLLEVEFMQAGKLVAEFEYDFSSRILNLSNITIEKQLAAATKAYILLSGLNLDGNTKTLYMDKINSNLEYVCIKDADINSINQISSNCQDTDEYIVPCNGNDFNGYTCTELADSYKITGLKHSGVVDYEPQTTSSDSGSSSSGGGGGSSYHTQDEILEETEKVADTTAAYKIEDTQPFENVIQEKEDVKQDDNKLTGNFISIDGITLAIRSAYTFVLLAVIGVYIILAIAKPDTARFIRRAPYTAYKKIKRKILE